MENETIITNYNNYTVIYVKKDEPFREAFKILLEKSNQPLNIEEIVKLRIDEMNNKNDNKKFINKLNIDSGTFFNIDNNVISFFEIDIKDIKNNNYYNNKIDLNKIIKNNFNNKIIKNKKTVDFNENLFDNQYTKEEVLKNPVWKCLISEEIFKEYTDILFKFKDCRKKMGITSNIPIEDLKKNKIGYLSINRSYDDGISEIIFNSLDTNDTNNQKNYSILLCV